MSKLMNIRPLRASFLVGAIFALSAFALSQTRYVVSNDDATFPLPTGVSFYSIAPNGQLTFKQQVVTDGFGIGGGFFGANRIATVNNANLQCVYASEAVTGDVVGISLPSFTVGGSAQGSDSDFGSSNGIGLATNGQYLFAGFSDSNNIGAFQLQPGCSLAFIRDVPVSGLAGGTVNGMTAHGNMLIATYTDGTIESFNISNGVPVSNSDKQYSTATLTSKDATYPNSIDITSDGRFAIFGDTSTSISVEVSDLSSGKLAKTVVHKSTASISSSNVILSPDETLLYVVNTQGDSVTAMFFNKQTGRITNGCTSGPIRGVSANFSYLVGVALASTTGNGGGVYVAEFGSSSGIALVKLTMTGKQCSLLESPKSPIFDLNTTGLLSIGNFPPRSF